MTFTEAAVEVLRREGKPLHFRKITEIAVRENLLDHVGKIPEEVMADQVAAHCRLPHPERLLMPVLAGTFALVEWQLDEDPTGLENLVDPPPLEELPYRARERHPAPAHEMARVSGRGGEKARRREEGEEKRTRRFPPPAEVAYEILASSGGAMSLGQIASHGAERQLMPDAFGRDHAALASALQEDNRRRESAGRRPLFQVDGETVTLASQPEPGERTSPAVGVARPSSPGDLRRSGLVALRRRLRECDPATLEHLVLKLLERLGYRDIKVARRAKEHVLVTARKRLGLVEIRHGFRVLRSGADASRRDVTETRRDLGHSGAQIGAIVTAGEAHRDARGDAAAPGQLPVLLLCGEALAEAFVEAALGCTQVVVPVVDDAVFVAAAEAAAREEVGRRGRRDERERHDGDRDGRGERREPRGDEEPRAALRGNAGTSPDATDPAAGEPVPAAGDLEQPPGLPVEARPAPAAGAELDSEGDESDEADEGDEGDDDGEAGDEVAAVDGAVPGAAADGRPAGEGRRRRRRRRRRGGRGRGEKREGTPGEAASGAASGAEAAPAGAADPGGGGVDGSGDRAPAAPGGAGSDPAAGGA